MLNFLLIRLRGLLPSDPLIQLKLQNGQQQQQQQQQDAAPFFPSAISMILQLLLLMPARIHSGRCPLNGSCSR